MVGMILVDMYLGVTRYGSDRNFPGLDGILDRRDERRGCEHIQETAHASGNFVTLAKVTNSPYMRSASEDS